jgi:hypothetical protein
VVEVRGVAPVEAGWATLSGSGKSEVGVFFRRGMRKKVVVVETV